MPASLVENKQQFLSGGGEMGERIRNFDWTKTALGDPSTWEQSLKTCVRIMLTSSQPIWIGWGKGLVKLYNDPYKAIVGGKHPWALGQPASTVWSDIWSDIEPMLKKVMEKDEGTYAESQLLIMERNNYPEETYYTFSYTPIPGDKGGTAGMICANTDDTNQILNERALQTLRDLGKLRYSEKSIQQIYSKAAQVLAANNKDFPSALFYTVNELTMTATAVAWAGDKSNYNGYADSFSIMDAPESARGTATAILENKIIVSEKSVRSLTAPKGYWQVASRQFLDVPLKLSNKFPVAVLSVGLNPFREYDKSYIQFIQLLEDQLVLEMTSMQALEEERKRSDALAEIDKAKTVFFNNISHEFRTPLTLMLGPLEELMQQPSVKSDAQSASTIAAAHRNAMRLLKLVNTLLDFSRIESGRQHANFTPVNLGNYTKDLASNFRSVMEKVGLQFLVQIQSGDAIVYVDKQMWEKIIFNLLSNAFKYTLAGSVTVVAFCESQHFVLQVIDSGIGIPAKELPLMFERFHRVEGAAGRTYEGSGIGLSMIKELVAMNGGTIDVESQPGKGTTFTVRVPFGTEHLEPAWINNAENNLEVSIIDYYVQEAAGLIDNKNAVSSPTTGAGTEKTDATSPVVLVVDDNADMREYIKSLLEKNYTVVLAHNGLDALQKIQQEPPSIILSDIMMPVMDGITLLRQLKEDVATSAIPVILLSARAGEESKIEGYDIGADDYLVKPFSARELLARIRSQLKITKTRKHTEQQLRNLFLQAPVAICIFRGADFIIEVANEKMLEFWGRKAEQVLNKTVWEALPDVKDQGFEQLLESVYKTGQRVVANEHPVTLLRHGSYENIFVKFVYEALYDEEGNVSGVMALADDITAQVVARQKIEESETRYRLLSATLENQVAERTNELIQNNIDLEKMNKELQSFAYISSHDLQEPLRKIQTFSSQIIEREFDNLSESGRDKFLRMQNAAKRMQALIEDLLAYSRTNTQEGKFEKTDLKQIIGSVLEDLEEEIKSKKATVEVRVSGTADIIPFQFNQLIYNLVSNSLKFSDPARAPHICIESETVNRKDADISGSQNYLRLLVSDNGIGFDQEYSQRIFEVFQRLHNRTQYAGTGIGLAIVKKIVENHHGTITAKGKINEGAEFDMLFPVSGN